MITESHKLYFSPFINIPFSITSDTGDYNLFLHKATSPFFVILNLRDFVSDSRLPGFLLLSTYESSGNFPNHSLFTGLPAGHLAKLCGMFYKNKKER